MSQQKDVSIGPDGQVYPLLCYYNLRGECKGNCTRAHAKNVCFHCLNGDCQFGANCRFDKPTHIGSIYYISKSGVRFRYVSDRHDAEPTIVKKITKSAKDFPALPSNKSQNVAPQVIPITKSSSEAELKKIPIIISKQVETVAAPVKKEEKKEINKNIIIVDFRGLEESVKHNMEALTKLNEAISEDVLNCVSAKTDLKANIDKLSAKRKNIIDIMNGFNDAIQKLTSVINAYSTIEANQKRFKEFVSTVAQHKPGTSSYVSANGKNYYGGTYNGVYYGNGFPDYSENYVENYNEEDYAEEDYTEDYANVVKMNPAPAHLSAPVAEKQVTAPEKAPVAEKPAN
jgi:hypothetical protein